jgi:tetraacyldisaccharide 4'-kinase
VLDAVLAPAESAYRLGVRLRNEAFDRQLLDVRRVSVPVISVGNVAVGGTGKTPFTHWLAVRLQQRGARPAVLHGGYAADEPELHRRWSPDIPVVAGRDRVRGAERAIRGGATVLVLDDAFQHRRLHRDLDIVLVSLEHWPAAERLLPRGPLREPHSALCRADLIVAARKTPESPGTLRALTSLRTLTERPVAEAHLAAAGWKHRDRQTGPPARPALLVSGIAHPGLFEQSVRHAGGAVAGVLSFADHHEYTAADAQRILEAARGQPVVTTEKDWIKLDRLLPPDAVWILTQEVIIRQGGSLIDAQLERVMA